MHSGRWTGLLLAFGLLAAGVAAHAWPGVSESAQDGGVIQAPADPPPPFAVELRSDSAAISTPLAAVGPSGPSGPSAPGPSGPSGPAAGPSGPEPGPSGPEPGPSGPEGPSGPSGPPVTQPPANVGVVRLAGDDRIATAIAVSQDVWDDGKASAVLLARSDTYPDALVGVPLAHARNAPLLLTGRTSLDSRVLAEIERVLPDGATVHLLGGTGALSADVEAAVKGAGFTVVRYAGTDRFDTSIKVAQALGSPAGVFLATGRNFVDALAAGAAAARTGRAVLLTDGDDLPAAVQQYIGDGSTAVAVGGPASRAAPQVTSIVGSDRYDTAFKLAIDYFEEHPESMGLATGENYPDGLSGGAHIAAFGGPLLITPTANLHPGTAALIDKLPDGGSLYLYGGTVALSNNVEEAAKAVVARD